MNIQFINPPFMGRFSRSQRSPGVIKSGTMYYPYWLAHAAALAEKRGHTIDLIDVPADNLTEAQWTRRVMNFRPDLIVLESVTASWKADCRTAARLKQLRPESDILMVGTHVTAMWKETLEREPAVDFVAVGEYDMTVSELGDELVSGKPSLQSVKGLAYRKNRVPVMTEERPLIRDLDSLPWIAPIYKRFLNPKHYYFNLSHHPMVMLIGGRGCTAMCFYCVYPQVMHGHRYRHRSPEHIVDEMLWIQTHMPEIREITFEDDNFAADPKFARRFAERVKDRNVQLPFFANLRTTVDFTTLKSLKQAGLRNTAVGFESGDDMILRNMRKGQDTSRQKQFVDNAHKLNLLVHGCFMVGFPGETHETMQKTLELARTIKPDSAQFYPVMPYPGTGAFAYYENEGYLAHTEFDQWVDDKGGHQCVINLPGLPAEEIEQFCEKAFRTFHFGPGYLLYKLKQALFSPREGWRSLLAGIHFIRYTLTHRKSSKRINANTLSTPPPGWHDHIKVPMGRMERLQKKVSS